MNLSFEMTTEITSLGWSQKFIVRKVVRNLDKTSVGLFFIYFWATHSFIYCFESLPHESICLPEYIYSSNEPSVTSLDERQC